MYAHIHTYILTHTHARTHTRQHRFAHRIVNCAFMSVYINDTTLCCAGCHVSSLPRYLASLGSAIRAIKTGNHVVLWWAQRHASCIITIYMRKSDVQSIVISTALVSTCGRKQRFSVIWKLNAMNYVNHQKLIIVWRAKDEWSIHFYLGQATACARIIL